MTKKKNDFALQCPQYILNVSNSNHSILFQGENMKKTLLLSLSLASSLLNAEDNGFFISAGYQIGEAAQ
ncbi:hypothetical protein HMPREF1425_00824, partial [Helicobacter pylori GAM71Ai]